MHQSNINAVLVDIHLLPFIHLLFIYNKFELTLLLFLEIFGYAKFLIFKVFNIIILFYPSFYLHCFYS